VKSKSFSAAGLTGALFRKAEAAMKYTPLVLALLLTGCSDTPQTQRPTSSTPPKVQPTQSNTNRPAAPVQPVLETTRTPLDGDVTITIQVTELPDQRVRLHGTTNLPTETNLMLSVEELAQGGFHGQSKCSVAADGSFDSETFGPSGGLKDGVYVAGVVMPIARVQPDNVKRIIGDNGEKLSGPLVENGSFGVTVSAENKFTIGGPQAAQAQQQRAKDRIQEYREWQNKVAALHSRLQTARGSRDPAKWGQFARQFRADIQSHQDELMQVQPASARFIVGDPLDAVRRMFHATTFQKPQDYNEAIADYTKSLKELQQFITESESTQ
jgi:hypothetical protein